MCFFCTAYLSRQGCRRSAPVRQIFDLLLYPANLSFPTVLAKKTTKNPGKTAAYPTNGKKLHSFGLFGRLFVLLGLGIFSLAVIFGGFLFWSSRPLPMKTLPLEFSVAPGASLGTVVARMQDAGIDVAEAPFKMLARYRGVAGKIKQGVYSVDRVMSPDELLGKMARGDVVQVEVSFPEGWSFRQLRARLDAHPDLRHELVGLSEAEIRLRIGVVEAQLEGLFFPDTYRLDKGSSDLVLLRLAYKAMQANLAQAWQARTPGGPLKTPYQALVLASIIEKETGRVEDRALVGSVFSNRLRLGMPLQSDPTVIYGMGTAFDGNIRKRDLRADNPYNTYTRGGLPPTPIGMPGRASLDAALRPVQSDAVYFVARGDGSSEFSATLDAHNRAVNRYQRGGK